MSEDQLRPSPGGGGVDAEAESGRRHAPVMVEEAVRFLHLKLGGFYVDGTLGDGGHAEHMLRADASIAVLGVDRDPLTLERTARRLAAFGSRFQTHHGNFSELDVALAAVARSGCRWDPARPRLLVATDGRPARGFGFRAGGPLDMRMHAGEGSSAADLVATLDERALADIFWRYGEEPASRRIARAIVADRTAEPYHDHDRARRPDRTHRPSPRRYASGDARLPSAPDRGQSRARAPGDRSSRACLEWLLPAGRLVIIAYHSLEDRMVKQAMRSWVARCTCPPALPRCVCGAAARVRILTKKAVAPSREEIATNRRARSAHLRAVEMLA